jgi:RES domain-containing protein
MATAADLTVWRITTRRFANPAASAFTGEGARLYGGRWNRVGLPMVYMAQSRSLALLEMLVQDEPLRAHYVLIPAVIGKAVSRTSVSISDLPENWRSAQHCDALQAIGQQWLVNTESCVLTVPSAVVPSELNYLINPLHPDFGKIKIGKSEPLETDSRLISSARS